MICVSHCVPTTQSNHLLSTYVWPHLPSNFLPCRNHHTAVYEFLCVLLFVHFLLSVLYPTYEWNHMVLNSFVWVISVNVIVSRYIMLLQMQYSSYGWVIFHCTYTYIPHLPYPIIYPRCSLLLFYSGIIVRN